MKKLIEIDESQITKLKLISAIEEMSVKKVIESAVSLYIKMKEQERFKSLSENEKEDLGLFMLMQQADREQKVSRDEIMNCLEE